MQYMLFICTDPDGEQPAPGDNTIEEWVADITARGLSLHGDRLRGVEDATTVRRRGSETVITDGPFAETRERIAGYDIIEVDTLDDAIEVAAAHPMARVGRVEVRPVWPLDLDLPDDLPPGQPAGGLTRASRGGRAPRGARRAR